MLLFFGLPQGFFRDYLGHPKPSKTWFLDVFGWFWYLKTRVLEGENLCFFMVLGAPGRDYIFSRVLKEI